uniref:Tr-type G domain-containing protein n=1 Tax=Parascaris univalens TaxID=6257 RepID=A0A915C5W8_PARUN
MSDDRSRRGLNPNAHAFVPNPGARPFVPGQPYMFATPPPMYGQPPPPFPVYQQPPQMIPAHMMQQTRMSMHVPPQMQMHYRQVPTQQHHPVRMQQQQPPLDAWDAEELEPEAPAPMEPLPEPIVAEPVKQEESEPPEPKTEPECEIETTPKSDESGAAGDKASPASDSAAEGKIEEEDEVVALPTKFKRSVYIDDGTRKEHVNIVFIGHVDAGKSTIGGQLMYLTGMVDKRTLEKYEKEAKDKGRESWYLSWALDTNDEEREKGKTVECGRAFFETEKKHFTILDAPGHKSFVPNMISGATQADLAVLVISARKGEFETGFDRGGQTREHAMLVKTAGVRHMIVLVNKMDDPTVNWDEERFKEIQNKLTPYLRKCGYNPKSDIFYIPVSGLTGAFLKDRPSAEFGSWYTYVQFVIIRFFLLEHKIFCLGISGCFRCAEYGMLS